MFWIRNPLRIATSSPHSKKDPVIPNESDDGG
jgi:hypothetical protein